MLFLLKRFNAVHGNDGNADISNTGKNAMQCCLVYDSPGKNGYRRAAPVKSLGNFHSFKPV